MSRRRKVKDITPAPSAPPAAKLSQAVVRRDSFLNTITGLGDSTRNKLTGMNQQYSGVLDVVFLEQLFKDSDLAWRIISSLPSEAMKDGFGLSTPAGDEAADDVSDQIADVMKEAERLQLASSLLEARIWGRGYGLGAIVLGIVGAGKPEEPFDEDNSPTATLSWLLVTDRREMIPASYYTDPEGEKFGEIETYRISPANQTGAPSWVVHETRVIRFPGVLTSRRERLRNQGCDYSVMQRVEQVLEQTEMNWEAVCQLMADMSQGVFSVKGLIDMIASGNEQALLTRMILLDKTRSTGRAICLDSDSEKFERVQTPMGGVNDAILRTWERLCAAAETPMFKLFGKSESGLGDTGQSQQRVWYDQCQIEREQVLAPRLLKIVKLISRNLGYDVDWRITWPSFWKMTAPELSAMYLQVAQADKIYMDSGVVLPEEVALGRFANGDEFNAGKLQIDANARKDALKAAIAELKDPTPTDPNGGNSATPGDAQDTDDLSDFKPPPPGSDQSRADDFEESKHPRGAKGEANGGEFTSGGGQASSSSEKDKSTSKSKSPTTEKSSGEKPAKAPSKAAAKAEARKAEIEKQSTPAVDKPVYHGTDIASVDSILKTGIKPTDTTMGVKTAWASTSDGLAHSYGGGAAAVKGHDEYAIVVVKSGKDAGLNNFRGDKSAAYSFKTITPDHIERVDVYKVNSKGGPVRSITRGADGKWPSVSEK